MKFNIIFGLAAALALAPNAVALNLVCVRSANIFLFSYTLMLIIPS